MAGKLYLAPVAAFDFLGASILDLNLVLNALMLAIAALVAVPLVRSRRKDGTITDLEKALHAKTELGDQLERDLAGATSRANVAKEASEHLRNELAAATARYEEQAKYTAEGAVLHLEHTLAEHREQVAERHERILAALEKLTARLDHH